MIATEDELTVGAESAEQTQMFCRVDLKTICLGRKVAGRMQPFDVERGSVATPDDQTAAFTREGRTRLSFKQGPMQICKQYPLHRPTDGDGGMIFTWPTTLPSSVSKISISSPAPDRIWRMRRPGCDSLLIIFAPLGSQRVAGCLPTGLLARPDSFRIDPTTSPTSARMISADRTITAYFAPRYASVF